jgi:hypothetical protein
MSCPDFEVVLQVTPREWKSFQIALPNVFTSNYKRRFRNVFDVSYQQLPEYPAWNAHELLFFKL